MKRSKKRKIAMASSEGKLDELRQVIDKIDDQLLLLLNRRAVASQKIGQIKEKSNSPVLSTRREHQILARLAAVNSGPLSEQAVDEVFSTIISNCRLLQKKMVIAFFGPEATFTHQAALRHFGKSTEYEAMDTIAAVFDEVEKGRADYGVVPIENSNEGVVNHTLDMFLESDLLICAEREDTISQCLLGTQDSLKKIKAIYSYSNALGQCRKWLESNLPGVPLFEAASTADAAARAATDDKVAAIASPLAAEIYHLHILVKGIEDSRHNKTRFLVIGKHLEGPSGRDKTSLVLSVKDRVGALYDLLAVFKKFGLNLTKIESRPTKKRAWEYVFFIDALGHITDEKVKQALEELREHCVFVKVLGSYPCRD
jgi:chorismate mutase/prephenate dehydratase